MSLGDHRDDIVDHAGLEDHDVVATRQDEQQVLVAIGRSEVPHHGNSAIDVDLF